MRRERIIADTGAILALLNQRDRYHEWALGVSRSLPKPLWTCEAVVTECWYLLQSFPQGRAMLCDLSQRGVLQIDFEFEASKLEVFSLLEKYHDTPMDFADACLVRMTEMTKQSRVWTVDSDFKIYRRNGRAVVPVLAPW